MTRATACSVLALCAVLVGALRADAQDALVLGGGGSRGLAHAGALIGLEEQGYRPELIVGTSIGSIIGALYAAGIDTDSIRALVLSRDWQELFAPPGWGFGPDWDGRRPLLRWALPSSDRYADGLIPDIRVNRLLMRLLFDANARAGSSFDRLPIPFRAVATDLRTGHEVVLREGDLALAVRASIAVPGVFAPVLQHDTVLVDGGIADYLPVGPARAAGGAHVIAVDVTRPPDRQPGLGPFQVMLRGLRLTLQNARRRPVEPDVLIMPDIDPDLAGAIFLRDPVPLLEAGRRAAFGRAPQLVDDTPALAPRAAPSTIESIVFELNDSSMLPLARAAFHDVIGEYRADAVLAAADRLLASGLFRGVWPRVDRGREGTDSAAVLRVRADAYSPTSVTGAVGYDDDRGARGWISLLHRFGGPYEAALALSGNSLDRFASIALRRPLAIAPALSFHAGLAYTEHDVRMFDADGDEISEREINRTGAWLALSHRMIDPQPGAVLALRIEEIETDSARGSSVGPYLQLSAPDRAGRVVGVPARLETEVRWGDFAYARLGAAGSIATKHGNAQAALVAEADWASDEAPADVTPALGDRHAMPGLAWGRDRDRVRVIGGIDGALASFLESWITLRLRAGAVASAFDDLADVRWLGGIETGILWTTPLGRLELGAGVNTRGDWRIHLDVGPR